MILDAEVSELDRRLVAAHLARCAECRAFEASVRQLTRELREAPLESPRQPISLPRLPRRVALATAQASAAATVLIAILGAFTQFGVQEQQSRTAASTPARNLFTTSWQPELELAQIDGAVSHLRGVNRPGPLPAL